jgi:hypothetical protein
MPLLGALGPSLDGLGRVSGCSWEVLGPLGRVLGGSWGPLGPLLGALGPSWDGLGPILGPCDHKIEIQTAEGKKVENFGVDFGSQNGSHNDPKTTPKRVKNQNEKCMTF